MKKVIVFICLYGWTTIFAQNEKQQADDMVIEANFSGAAMMYRMCMEQDEQCLMKLFKLIYEKKVDLQSTDELYQLIRTPAERGNAEAQYYLGEMYLIGNGVSKNDREAMNWLRKSAKSGNIDAHNRLKTISQDSKVTKQTRRKNIVSLSAGFNEMTWPFSNKLNIELPFFNLSYERIVIDKMFNGNGALGIGGVVGCSYSKYFDENYYNIIFGIRGALHYSFIEKLDTYIGVMGGYNYFLETYYTDTYFLDEPTYAIFAGARYHIFNSISVYAEAVYGYSIVNVGLSYSF